MKAKGFIGLRVMGFPMASHLENGGNEVCVYNRSPTKSELWSESHKGSKYDTPAEIGAKCDVVFLCVGRDEDVRSVLKGKKVFWKLCRQVLR